MVRISQLLTNLSLLMLLANAQALQAQPTTPAIGKIVYRLDASPPDEVFSGGIVNSAPAEGTLNNYNILDHALGLMCGPGQRSPWISTTRSGPRLNEFLRRQADATPLVESPLVAWVYTIETDDSYLDVLSVVNQVIEAGQHNQYGYGHSHAQTLQRILQHNAIRDINEVLTLHIAPERIVSASRVTLQPGQPIQWGSPINNPNRRQFTPDGNSHLPELSETVPPNSRIPSSVSAVQPGNGTCFQTCDGAHASDRMKRSATSPALNLCAVRPTRAQRFIGSED